MKVILATGGTGGHLFPALLVAEQLIRERHEVLLVGAFPVGRDQIQKRDIPFVHLDVKGITFRSVWGGCVSLWLMIKAVVKAHGVLRQYRPDVVVGFGGYGSCPAVCAAKGSRLPTMIHEQNRVPGRANALLSRVVDRVAVSFEASCDLFARSKVVWTGCPCHHVSSGVSENETLAFFGFPRKQFTILVFGGSQGSVRINEVFLASLSELKNELDFQVIHITGRQNFDKIKQRYASSDIPVALYGFLDKMGYAYALADLVIARAGAVTVTEIISAQIPSILIPYPGSYGDHQRKNAGVLHDAGLATLIDQEQLNPHTLTREILKRAGSPRGNSEKKNAFVKLTRPDAARALAQVVEALGQGRKMKGGA
jgi:UDP-N-acetylglucosamine--N-acetylmuramyl-(pentapeptide) pyrophosphoryl-undecaprenol N-acetylglucosamine transferase